MVMLERVFTGEIELLFSGDGLGVNGLDSTGGVGVLNLSMGGVGVLTLFARASCLVNTSPELETGCFLYLNSGVVGIGLSVVFLLLCGGDVDLDLGCTASESRSVSSS